MTRFQGAASKLRALPVLLALVYGWAQMAAGYTWLRSGGEPGSDYLLAFIVSAALLLGVTVLVLAGLRLQTLRRALLPLELSLVVAAVVLVAGARGTHIDTESDVFAIALLFSAGSLVVLSFLGVLLDHRRSRGPWLAGVAAVIAGFGLAVPAALHLLDSQVDAGMPTHAQVASAELMSAFDPSGLIRLGFDHDPYGLYADHMVDGGRAMLFADRHGALTLGLSLPRSFRGAYRAELRAGRCTDGARGRTVVARFRGTWPRVAGQVAEHRVPALTLAEVAATDLLHARWGSGRPLDEVHCSDLLDARRVAVAGSGGADFFARCVAPLRLEGAGHTALTPESMQDARCAREMSALVTLSSAQPYETRAKAAAVVACLAEHGVDGRVREVAGAFFVPISGANTPETGGCFPPVGAPVAVDAATGLPVDPSAGSAVPGHPAEAYGTGTAAVAPAGVPRPTSFEEDLGGVTPEALAEKLR